MRPAYSVILFTTLSGAGYGLLTVLGVMLAAGVRPEHSVAALALGLLLASVGLLASTRHLGRPERAWRAFSQWRTSWLSREGAAALSVYAAALPLAGLMLADAGGGLLPLLAAIMTVLSVATIWCTAMIYASLKPIPQWRHPTVVPAYLLLALSTGSLALAVLSDAEAPRWVALSALVAGWLVKEVYWRHVRHGAPTITTAAATGLGAFGEVRLLDRPHTESNYLLHEMGHRVGRKHAARLRQISRILAFALPIALVATAAVSLAWMGAALPILAALSALLGTLVERWLFFAEARHTVALYYGTTEI